MRIRPFLLLVLAALPIRGAEYGLADYDVTPVGARSVYAGHVGLVPFWVSYRSGGLTQYFYYDSITGAPAGVTAEVFCNNTSWSYFPCAGTPLRQVYPYPQFSQAVRVTASPEAVPGDYTLTLRTHDLEGHSHTTAIPLRILPAPEAPQTPATYQPPVPDLARWRQAMVSEGARFCNADNKNQVFGFGYEGSVWYYDGARVFYQIYDATGQEIFRECAENVASQYADWVNSSNCQNGACGSIPAWRVFSRGLRMAYERTGSEKYRIAVENLAAHGIATQRPGGVVDSYIRETAYAADSLIDAKLMGNPRYETVYALKLRTLIDELLAMYETLFDARTYIVHQPFYDGLAAHALIDYYQHVTPDPRIPLAIKKMLDWTWEVGWDKKAKILAYQPDHVPWFGYNNLLGLTVPAYGWYYKITGDVTYLQRGDELFGHMFDEPLWSGKQFSQTFRWTFDYVNWRSPMSGEVGITVPEHLYPSGDAKTTIRLPEPAAGNCGEGVRFATAPAMPGWPETVSVARGSDSTTATIRPVNPQSRQKVTVTATYRSNCGVGAVAGRAATTVLPDHLDVVLGAARIPGGMIPNSRIMVDGPALADGTAIGLSSDRPELVRFYNLDGEAVDSVAMAGGKGRSHYFYLDTGYVEAPTPVTVTATVGDLSGSATIIIDPPAPRIALRNGIKIVGGFGTCFNQVVIDQPAPAGGTVVSVWTTDKKHFADTLEVTVPQGQVSAFFCATPGLTAASENYIHSIYGSGKYFNYMIVAETRALKLTGVPATVRSGASSTVTVTFDGWIPANADITLTSSDASLVVPQTLVIARSTSIATAAGQAFTIRAGVVTAARTVTITATSSSGHSATAMTTLTP